jgi:hypothetical protein
MHWKRLQIAEQKARKVFKKYHRGCIPQKKPKKYFIKSFNIWVYELPPLGFYRKTKVYCSRACCGNPRRHYGELTRQERRANRIDEEY